MKNLEIQAVRRAISLLHGLVPDDEPHEVSPLARRCPVAMFAQHYLARDPASDLTSAELWTFFAEVSASGEVEPLSKSEFLRRLPGVMTATFDVRKSHNLQRTGGRQRGFKGVGIRMDTYSPAVPELPRLYL